MDKQVDITNEDLKELQRFQRLFGSQNEGKDVVNFFYRTFLYSYMNGNTDTYYFLKTINDLKESNPEFVLSRERKYEHKSLYSPFDNTIHIDKSLINSHDIATVFHEAMHFIHENSNLHSHVPKGMEEERNKSIDNILLNKDKIIELTKGILEKNNRFREKAHDFIYTNYIFKNGVKNVAEYVELEAPKYESLVQKEGIFDELIQMGFNLENAQILNSKTYSHELDAKELVNALIQQIYNDKCEEYSIALVSNEKAYEGFINAILNGEHQEELLMRYGHEKEYFSKNSEKWFQEVLACYSEIRNSVDGEQWLKLLEEQVGLSFMNKVEEVYAMLISMPLERLSKDSSSISL